MSNFGKKAPIGLVPASAIVLEALAMADGARKYGPYSWREKPVVCSIERASAAMRHILSWMDREECASDSGIPHLAHARADLGILLDAAECGMLVDDRPAPGKAGELIEDSKKP
jgi:hypothetical protein